MAARDLGEEALLVYSREATLETRYLGAYEVVFAQASSVPAPSDASEPAPLPGPPAPLLVPPAEAPMQHAPAPLMGLAGDAAAEALAELRREIGSLRQDVAAHRRYLEAVAEASDRRAWQLLADWGEEPELGPGVALASRLLHADMDPEHALDLIECSRDTVRQTPPDASRPASRLWRRALEQEMAARLRVDPRLGTAPSVLLTGPAGAGKTTVSMQLAAQAVSRGLSPSVVAFEPGRLAAAQTLRSYAAVLGAPFEIVRRGDRLAGLLEQRTLPAPVLIDGPGLGPLDDDDAAAETRALLARSPSTEVWLVLPATLRLSDLKQLVRRFAPLRPARLIYTRTAETRHWGALWSSAASAGLPVAYFCDGPRIPEDLQAGSGSLMAARLLREAGSGGVQPPSSIARRERTLAAPAAGSRS